MMRRFLPILLLLCFLLKQTKSYCQTDPQVQLERIIPVAPTAASIAKYGNIPVSYFTGSPSVNIPMFEASSGELKVPVSLSYQYHGLKVEEIAPWVGLGWNLQAGGAISRTVRGIEDEGGYGYMGSALANQMTVKFMIDHRADPNHKTAIEANLRQAGMGLYDTEPDIFYFNFPGASGKFYFNQEEKKFFSLPAQNISISFSGNGFLLITEEGTRYHFTEKESTAVSAPYCNNSPAQAGTVINTTSWYLSKIENKTQTDSITFEYTDTYYSFENIAGNSRYFLLQQLGGFAGTPPEFTDQLCWQTTTITGKGLSQIRFRSGRLKFTAFSNSRCDLYGDKALEKIELFNAADQLLRSFRFEYGYFEAAADPGNCTASNTALRLKLKKVWEETAGSIPLPPHEFTYEEAGNFPHRLSYEQDHWGFYNGATTNQNLIPTVQYQDVYGKARYVPGANRKPNFNFAKLGSIKKITYPAGGSTEFTFENNEVKDPAIQPEFQWRVEHLEGDHQGGVQTSYEKTFVINEPPNYYNFNNPNGGAYVDVFFDAIGCTFPNGQATNCALLTVEGINGPLLGPFTSNHTGVFLPNGTYKLKAVFNQNPPGYEDFYFSVSWRQPVLNGSNLVGGLRIKKLVDRDGVDPSKDVVRVFSYTGDADSVSSGKVCGYPNSYITDFNHEYYSSQYLGQCTLYELFRDYKKINSTSNYPLVAHQGGYVGYEQVNVFLGEEGQNGKTVYKYQYFPDEIGGFPATATSKEWLRGLPLEEKVYKKTSGQYALVKKDSFVYDVLINYDSSLLQTTYGLKLGFQKAVTISDQGCGGLLAWDQRKYNAEIPIVGDYLTETGNSIVASKYSTVYEDGRQIVTSQQFSYNSKNYLPKEIKSLTSKGDTIITRYKYNVDYTLTAGSPAWLKQLVDRKITAVPVEKLTIRKAAGGSEYVIGGVVSQFKTGRPLLDKVYALEINQPVLLSSFAQSSVDASGNFIKDPRYKEAIAFNAYDQFNNVVAQQKANDHQSSFIWDYKSAYPIAECIGADSASIAFTSFESDGSGSWSGVSGSGIQSAGGFTGSKHYGQTGFILSKSGLSSTAAYWVSYWSKNGAYSVSGTQTGWPKSVRTLTVNEQSWTQYEHKISGVSTASVSGSGALDELRLYPASAQMTTYTYEPLIGMSSSADANGIITYYEYDAFGRLLHVRDEAKNILKKFCYNYQGQQEECTAYGNTAQSGTFTRTNCGTNYVGGSVTYTVAAGTYFATTQAAADQLAQQDVAQNGPAYANQHGTCTQVYYSTQKSGTFTKQCSSGGTGSQVTYTVAAGTYSSTISQADADQKAQNDVNANGQNYANANGTCTWYNVAKSGSFTKQCSSGGTGSLVTYTVAAAKYSSTISQADADAKAQAEINANGQAYANSNGTCTFVCSSSNCSGQDKKCVNNVCETGIKVYTTMYYNPYAGMCERTYHYEFSDGSWSINYVEYVSGECPQDS